MKKIGLILVLAVLSYNILYIPCNYLLGHIGLQLRPWVGQFLYWLDAGILALGILWMNLTIASSAKSSDSTLEKTSIGFGAFGMLAALLIYLFFAFFFYAFFLNPKKEEIVWFEGEKYVSCEWSEGLGPTQRTLHEYHGWFAMEDD